ncbi:MAG: hypothetical protein KKG60_03440 [Nanoarchaeota archaeon]|nr:hypothetical protein [Nanoarchaeota archaeon]
MNTINVGISKTKKFKRLLYIDIFRGFSLLVMAWIHIFNALWVSNIYLTSPYYVKSINSITWIPPSILFTFVSGMSVFLLVKKRLFLKKPKLGTVLEIIKRYGIYVLISLPLTTIMWGINTYLRWDEAIQGIGFTAIITAIFIVLFLEKKYFKKAALILIFLCAGLQHYLLHIFNIYRINISVLNIILNIFFRGWFSVINLLPFMLGGILFFQFIQKKHYKKLFLYGLSFAALSIIFHFYVIRINYYQRSLSLTFLGITESIILFSVLYAIYQKLRKDSIVSRFLEVYGKSAFFVYVFHLLVIVKVLEITGLGSHLSAGYSWLITVPLLVLIYYPARMYLKKHKKHLI